MSPGRHTLIVGAAPVPGAEAYYARVIAGASMVIAADAGLVLCRAVGRVPDICVGDFDSTPADLLTEAESAGARVIRFPAEKDHSDLDLALEAARESDAGEVHFSAAFAGRLDHTLAALGTVMAAADVGGRCDEPGWTGYALRAGVNPRLLLAAPHGTVISIIALGGSACVTAEGFRYPLSEATVDPLSSLGLSNIATGSHQTVEVSAGGVLVIVNRSRAVQTLQSGLEWTDTL